MADASPYRVLARKYRPASFAELIGQEPMVRTLTNAFASGRIAQAYLLTGVRGVGKTTTARILARALNYSLPGKVDRPSIDFSEIGEHCAAIMEGRHVDVIEMDAASHTGIGDIREIIEAVRYKPATARYKVYIIDEVHMLSNQAFNGLLKTLEEPPEHVKFIFATTEIRKVPVTVLSRTQRFDLRRIGADRLVGLLRDVTTRENVAVEDEALRMIARAAEGSARDSLSLLDQAIAHGAGDGAPVTGETVRQMLGLADRARVIDLFETVMRGDAPGALGVLADLYASGADPTVVLQDLAGFTHLVTRLRITPEAGEDPSLTEEERTRGGAFAAALPLRVLSRAWQMLLKGIEETKEAARPLAAADMVLVRLAHAADLPTPDEALRALRDGGPAGGGAPSLGAPRPAREPVALASAPPRAAAPVARAMTSAAPAARPAAGLWSSEESAPQVEPSPGQRIETIDDLVAIAASKRDLPMKVGLERYVRPIKIEPGRIELSLTEEAPPSFVGELAKHLADWTGRRWVVTVGRETGGATVHERAAAARAQMVTDARADPLVAAVLEKFPGAEIVDVRVNTPATTEMLPTLPLPADPEAGVEDEEEDD